MTDYFFTITLRPVMYKKDIDEQYDISVNQLLTELKILSDKITLVVELTKQMNVHMHGLIYSDKFTFRRKFINAFRQSKIFGFVQLNPLYDKDKTRDYLIKDLSNSKILINRQPIIIDNYDLFDIPERLNYGTFF